MNTAVKPYWDVDYLNAFAAIHALNAAALNEWYGIKLDDMTAWAIANDIAPRTMAEMVSRYLERHDLTAMYEGWINGGCR